MELIKIFIRGIKKISQKDINVYQNDIYHGNTRGQAGGQGGYVLYPIRHCWKITRNQCKPLWWPHQYGSCWAFIYGVPNSVPLWNTYRTLQGGLNTIIHPYFNSVKKKIKKSLTELLSVCIIYINSSYQRVTHKY